MIAGSLVLFVESALAGEDWGLLFGASASAWYSLAYCGGGEDRELAGS